MRTHFQVYAPCYSGGQIVDSLPADSGFSDGSFQVGHTVGVDGRPLASWTKAGKMEAGQRTPVLLN